MNERPFACALGIHRTDKTRIYAKRVTGTYFRTFCRCEKCGELVEEGSFEIPLPQSMSNIELEILEDGIT